MEEVAGGAAVLVDPLDSASIAAGIEQAAAARDELVPRGLERARAFRWDAVAAATRERLSGGARVMLVVRRRRARPPAHRRRDVRRASCCAALPGPPRTCGSRRSRATLSSCRKASSRSRSDARSQELRMAVRVPARCCRRLRPALAHFVHALPLRLPVPGRAHGAGPLVRARSERDGLAGSRDLQGRCAAGGASAPVTSSRSRSGRSATSSSCTARRRRRSSSRRSASDPDFRPADEHDSLPALRRRDRAAQAAARRARRRQRGRPRAGRRRPGERRRARR